MSGTGITAGIAVVGKGEIKGEPDAVTIEIGVQATRDSVAQATADAATKARSVVDALIANGVARDNIQTRNLAVNPNYEYPPGGHPRLVGYQFTNTVVATIRDLDAAGAIIDAALAAGGDDAVLQGLSFRVDDDAKAVVDARAAAYADCRAKAEQLAELAGVRLGAALSIEETTGVPPNAHEQHALRSAALAASTVVVPGQVTTSVILSVRYAIA
jgi:uncharacterized protein YggE